MDLVEMAQALSARDAGMIEAEFAETLSGSDYPTALAAAIKHVALRQCEVHIDHVLPSIKVDPKHPNSAGAARGWTASSAKSFAASDARPTRRTRAFLSGLRIRPVLREEIGMTSQHLRSEIVLVLQPESRSVGRALDGLQATTLSYVSAERPVHAGLVDRLVLDFNGYDEFAAREAADFLQGKELQLLPADEASGHGSAPSPTIRTKFRAVRSCDKRCCLYER